MCSGFQFITPEGAMCGICLEFYYIPDLFEDKDGQVWDVCKDCAKKDGR